MTLPGNVGDRLAHGDQAAVVARRASHLSEAGVLPHWHVMVSATVNERVKYRAHEWEDAISCLAQSTRQNRQPLLRQQLAGSDALTTLCNI